MPQKFGDGRGWRFWSVFLGAASLDQSALTTARSSNQSLVAVDPQHEAEILTIWYKASSTHNLIHHTPLHIFNFFHFLSNCSTLTPELYITMPLAIKYVRKIHLLCTAYLTLKMIKRISLCNHFMKNIPNSISNPCIVRSNVTLSTCTFILFDMVCSSTIV